jgi:hypothetical protein
VVWFSQQGVNLKEVEIRPTWDFKIQILANKNILKLRGKIFFLGAGHLSSNK